MKQLLKGIVMMSMFALPFTGCKEDEEVIAGTGSLTIDLENRAGDVALDFGTNYVNAAGDTVQFSMFNYTRRRVA